MSRSQYRNRKQTKERVSEMRKEWFEEVGGKPSRFVRAYNYAAPSRNGVIPDIGAAFRQLLAEDAAAGEPELTSADILAGEVVQLEKQLDAANAELAAYRKRVDAGKKVSGYQSSSFARWVWGDALDRDTHTALLIDIAEVAPAVEPAPKKEYFRREGMDVPFVIECERTGKDRRGVQMKGTLDLYGERVFYRSGEGFNPCLRYKASRYLGNRRNGAGGEA
jgi:hypothetical protein